MDIYEKEALLNSFEVCCDSREQPTDRAVKRYESMGCPYGRYTLNYGDYTYNLTFPDGHKLYSQDETIYAKTVICERKMHLDELAQCMTTSRDRFAKEFQRAQDNGARIFLIVENASWENLINGKYRTKFHPNAFFASIIAWIIRYNITPIFCKAETSGKIIKEILYRDAKNRIERGEFDEGQICNSST